MENEIVRYGSYDVHSGYTGWKNEDPGISVYIDHFFSNRLDPQFNRIE